MSEPALREAQPRRLTPCIPSRAAAAPPQRPAATAVAPAATAATTALRGVACGNKQEPGAYIQIATADKLNAEEQRTILILLGDASWHLPIRVHADVVRSCKEVEQG